MSAFSNKFVSQSEVDEKRKQRQEEWEQKRKPDDPVECPEEVIDNRSLYDKLQEQKLKKDEEYEEQHKLKNSVKGLNEDEAQFLEFVSNKQIEINKARSEEEKSIFKELKESSVSRLEPSTSQENKPIKVTTATQGNKKSQTALLAGAVKRKGTGDGEDCKKRKVSEEKSQDDSSESSDSSAVQKLLNQQPKIIGVLPGLGAYDNDTSDSETSSSDSDCDFKLVHRKIKIHIEQQ